MKNKDRKKQACQLRQTTYDDFPIAQTTFAGQLNNTGEKP
jgi:hypothetical protein